MKVQVNSDRTVSVDARLKEFVRGEAARILDTVAPRVTRLEIHLSDVNAQKAGPPDKRCVVEARPAGVRPLKTSATAKRFDAAIGQALRKMLRALRSLFGRHDRTRTASSKPRVKKAAATPKAKTRATTKPKTSTVAKRARRSD